MAGAISVYPVQTAQSGSDGALRADIGLFCMNTKLWHKHIVNHDSIQSVNTVLFLLNLNKSQVASKPTKRAKHQETKLPLVYLKWRSYNIYFPP